MKTIADLTAIRQTLADRIALRRDHGYKPGAAAPKEKLYSSHVMVCAGTGCVAGKAYDIIKEFNKHVDAYGLKDDVSVVQTGCFGLCAVGPIVIVYPEGIFYSMVEVSDVEEITREHLKGGNVVKRKVYGESICDDGHYLPLDEVGFYKKQMRLSLRNCGVINPDSIDEYIATDGYLALERCLTDKKPSDVIDEIKASGLRGRGGAGFSTGMKWQFAANAVSPDGQKYIACNADEGDPGAFMDRSILEGDPHVIIEAMAIAAYAVGANFGYVYVRAEYPIAMMRLQKAIDDARAYGLLGKNILGTGFDFDMKIKPGAGAFVCGEETALIRSIEGSRGEPRPRPPFPAVAGIFGKPTVLNNVETYACIPRILMNGAEWFNAIGTDKSKGTKVFAFAGKINNIGLVEIPMGITLREVVYEIGGGIPGGKAFKAAQTGGPSGGCIPAQHLDTPIDFESLTGLGAMMGSGGLVIMDEDNCMVDIAKFFLEFTVDESCGKCPPCRIGTKRMYEILEKITQGNGELEDIDRLESLAKSIQASALCGLGQTAPNPVLSTIKYFRDEYEAHCRDKKCPAKACSAMANYFIDQEKCKRCTLCVRACPVNAITGKVKEEHILDQSKCIKCGACVPACKFNAIYVE
ncbi:MAG: NADH-quinone oxidoreductase subunit NuoF [Defluviitaleaceae bacterium]|nr:NADH-quinone oxidoreductase subunit NuoF [Defluviitaleaceae bacterium]